MTSGPRLGVVALHDLEAQALASSGGVCSWCSAPLAEQERVVALIVGLGEGVRLLQVATDVPAGVGAFVVCRGCLARMTEPDFLDAMAQGMDTQLWQLGGKAVAG